jgi:hypothetical protein
MDEHIKDAPSDSEDDIADEYDTLSRVGTQPEWAPLHDYLVILSHHYVVSSLGYLKIYSFNKIFL